jgi:hypothetical protein
VAAVFAASSDCMKHVIRCKKKQRELIGDMHFAIGSAPITSTEQARKGENPHAWIIEGV